MTIEVVEVGPRDGLQSEDTVLAVDERIDLIRRLVGAGLRRIEVASFVHPRRVPQMADAEAVVAGLPVADDVAYIGLVLNERGLERALETAVDEINLVVAAAEGYARSNAGASVNETMSAIERMIPRALDASRRVSVTISVAFGDPYDGEVAPDAVASLAGRAEQAGADEVALGDTIGVAVPARVGPLVQVVRAAAPSVALRCHFHDTRHAALGNVAAGIDAGVRVFDASVGGIGGSPFAPSTGGNVGTEDLLFMLDRMGMPPAIDATRVVDTARWLTEVLGHDLPASASRLDPWP